MNASSSPVAGLSDRFSFYRFYRGLLLAVLSLAPFTGFSGRAASAQTRGPVQRIVTGKVIDKSNNPVHSAVVYIKDDKTMAVKSFISDENGGYRFGQLTQNTDYELWAEVDGKKSGVKTISSFESKNNITLDLKMDK